MSTSDSPPVPEIEQETDEEKPSPQKRPDLLNELYQEEIEFRNNMIEIDTTLCKPTLEYFEKHPEIITSCPEAKIMLSFFPDAIKSKDEFIKEFAENVSAENIQGPIGSWIVSVPKQIHQALLFFHHYYLYLDPLVDIIESYQDLVSLRYKFESKFSATIFDVFTEMLNYLVSLERHLQKILIHTTPGHPDRAKLDNSISEVKSAIQRGLMSLNDGIPDSAHGFTFIKRDTEAPYGKHAEAVSMEKPKPGEAKRTPLSVLIISKVSKRSKEMKEQIEDEIEANQILSHRNILKMKQYIEDELFHYLFFPNCHGMSLADIIKKNGKLDEAAARPIFREIVLALQNIFSTGFVHRDIKPENIVFYQNRAKLCNFSKCQKATRSDITCSGYSTLLYASPESLKPGYYNGSWNDIWSSGVVLYEMLAGKNPFHVRSTVPLMERVRRGSIVYPNFFSSPVVFLLKGILNSVPYERYSIEQILSHAWILKTEEIPIQATLAPEEFLASKKKKRATSKRFI